MKILILGATGFIGSAILARLVAEGHAVTGLGRDPAKARQRFPGAHWIAADLARLAKPEDFTPLIENMDAVINCAGALQDGQADDLHATQQRAMIALYEEAQRCGRPLIVQISARTEGAAADLPFLKTRRQADEALKASGLPHVILRPALVIGRNAHGGTALLRALAALPLIQPLIHARQPVEAVALDDVTKAVSMALSGGLHSGSDLSLASGETATLADLVALHRGWLGLPKARIVPLPAVITRPVSWLADLAGWFGWRSPLRSTAMAVMSEGVIGNRFQSAPFAFTPIVRALAEKPSGVQDLWFARLYLLKPVAILTLSLFWLLSGLVPFFGPSVAAAHFAPFMPASAALGLLFLTCALDVALGLAVLYRPHARRALLGMLAVALAYLGGGTLLEPGLWLDPLGPYVKVLPSLALTLATLAILDER